jgi:hypothetical protein
MNGGANRPGSLAYAFAPIHKAALGVASGMAFGLLVALVTGFHVLAQPPDAPPLALLAQYFYGYTVSGSGVVVGFAWGFFSGFVIGWFAGFVRNVVVTVAVFALRTKAELKQTADLLDHI